MNDKNNLRNLNNESLQSRLRSPTLWISLVALIAFISKTYLGYEIPKLDELVNMVLAVAVGFGIFNNPTDKKSV